MEVVICFSIQGSSRGEGEKNEVKGSGGEKMKNECFISNVKLEFCMKTTKLIS